MKRWTRLTSLVLSLLILTALAANPSSPAVAFLWQVSPISNMLSARPSAPAAVSGVASASSQAIPNPQIPFEAETALVFEPAAAAVDPPQSAPPAAVELPAVVEPAAVEARPVVEPLRLVFPTPAKPPITAWRPALYPVPWAPHPYDHFYFTRPIAADEINWPVWDYRYGGNFIENVYHTGIDIPTLSGTPVLAAGSGEVVWAGYGLYRGGFDKTDPYGMAVAILHDFGYQNQALFTVYGHMNQIDVVPGQQVAAGEVLGLSGATGKVTGPHLHFEVRIQANGFFSTRNPELWLSPPQGWGVLAARVMNTAGILKTEQMVIVTSTSTNQNWIVRSYGPTTVNSDPYYQENLVLSDLPAGIYEIRIPYGGVNHRTKIEIQPGRVSYFSFYGHDGFEIGLPPAPGADFNPSLDTAGLP